MSKENLPVTGSIKWFNATKGYGFFQLPDEAGSLDIFCHANQLRKSGINRTPVEGECFKFCVNQGPKGAFATDITVVEGLK